jgi:hypothetical protein
VRPGQRFVGGVRHYVRVADEVLSATTVLAAHAAARRPGLAGDPVRVPTPWDPGLAAAMARHDIRIEEELSLDTLLADLA